MSDTIGTIGQKYEDRKSKKVGTLVSRDAESKKLSFLDENAEPFHVSFAAFKSNWRKVVAEPVQGEFAELDVEPESSYSNVEVAEPDVEPSVTIKTTVLDTEDDKIKDFVKALTEARVACVEVTPTNANVMADDITICTLDKVDGGFKMFMLPDIFIFTEWGNTFKAGDVHFNIKHGRHIGVSVDCVRASLGDILQLIKTAAVEINLYGYID
jgi:hypothetical protein